MKETVKEAKEVNNITSEFDGQNDQNQNTKMKTYTYQEALADATSYFKGDELAANVWINKYALKDSAGNIYESNPDQMHRRLAKEIARIEL